MTTIADKLTVKVVGEPERGKPDFRFDEGELESEFVGEPIACGGQHTSEFDTAPAFYSTRQKRKKMTQEHLL